MDKGVTYSRGGWINELLWVRGGTFETISGSGLRAITLPSPPIQRHLALRIHCVIIVTIIRITTVTIIIMLVPMAIVIVIADLRSPVHHAFSLSQNHHNDHCHHHQNPIMQ